MSASPIIRRRLGRCDVHMTESVDREVAEHMGSAWAATEASVVPLAAVKDAGRRSIPSRPWNRGFVRGIIWIKCQPSLPRRSVGGPDSTDFQDKAASSPA
jgi:hypothetical protein